VLQLALGLIHHLLWKKRQRPTILSYIHVYLGPLILIAGTANGFIGFSFAGGSYHNVMYGVIVGVFYSGLIGALFWARVRRKAQRRENEGVADEAYEEFKGENRGPRGRLVGREMHNDHDHDVELRGMPKDASTAYVDENHVRPVEARALV
jgi:hypothetical protein